MKPFSDQAGNTFECTRLSAWLDPLSLLEMVNFSAGNANILQSASQHPGKLIN